MEEIAQSSQQEAAAVGCVNSESKGIYFYHGVKSQDPHFTVKWQKDEMSESTPVSRPVLFSVPLKTKFAFLSSIMALSPFIEKATHQIKKF